MDTLRCFDSVRLGINIYDGAAEKTSFVDDDKRYLLKFGQANEVKRWADQASYTNTPVNEYLGSKIFASTGIPTQEVFLGTYQGRSCVACLDFTYDEGSSARLIPFKQLETSMPGESSRSQRTPSLEFLTHVFNDHEALGSLRAAAFERYRQTICVDALIGNFDRHTGNWGFLSFDDGMTLSELAPVYDCGSSLYSQASDETIEKLLSSDSLARSHIHNRPLMALTVDGHRQRYDDFFLSDNGRPFRAELADIWQRIDLDKISGIIYDAPGIDDLHKDFYIQTICLRYEEILAPARNLAVSELGHSLSRNPSLSERVYPPSQSKDRSATLRDGQHSR